MAIGTCETRWFFARFFVLFFGEVYNEAFLGDLRLKTGLLFCFIP